MNVEAWEQETERAWSELEQRLGAWLAEVPADGHVVIQLAWPADRAEGGAAPYVQFAIEGYDVRAEAVSNDNLATRFHLESARIRELFSMGWQDPEYDDSGNFWHHSELPEEAEAIAGRLTRTLRDVFGVPDPSFLETYGFTEGAPMTEEDLPLGLRIAEPEPRPDDLTAIFAESPDELRDLAAEALASLVAGDVEFDADGDIPVATGGAPVYIRVDEQSPSLHVFTTVLIDVRWTPRVGFELNRANTQLGFARLSFRNGFVFASYQMHCRPFVPELLRQAVIGMTGLAEDLPDKLQQLIGGELIYDSEDGAA